MGERLWDSFDNLFDINYTQNERKRDKYRRLHVGIIEANIALSIIPVAQKGGRK